MKNLFRYRYDKILLAVIVIGLAASLLINQARIAAEKKNDTIDLVVDYEGLVELAEREGLPPSFVLKKAKEAGITSLAVYDRTFKKLNQTGKAAAVSGAEILARYDTGALVSPDWRNLVEHGEIVGNQMYVTGRDETTFRETKEDLIRRLGAERVHTLMADGHEVLAVKAHGNSFIKLDLGLPTDEMKTVNAAGFKVVVRPTNYVRPTADDVAAVFQRLDGIEISELVFSGRQALGALGAENALSAVADELNARNITLGLIEAPTQLQFFPQEGLLAIAQGVKYRAARLYSIDKAEREKMKVAQAIDRWKTTCEERNIRIALLHIFEKAQGGLSLLDTNLAYFSGVRDVLKGRGYRLGAAGVFLPLAVPKWQRVLVIFGATAAGVLYLSLVLPYLNERPKYQYILLAAVGLLLAAPVLLGAGNSARLATALASANLFPALAMTALLDYIKERKAKEMPTLFGAIGFAAILLLVTGTLSFIGAEYLSAALSDVEYFLEVNVFRGVKLTFVLPIILVAISFLQRFNIFSPTLAADEAESFLRQAKEILSTPVTVKMLGFLGLAFAALVVFIARSGHNMGMPVPGIELKLRAFLEQALYARPRTKEMLIGHPAFMLMICAWRKKWPTVVFFALVLAATIAQGSMVETFAHMRTPFVMSAARGIGGLVLGGAIGAGLMMLVSLWYTILNKAK